MINGLGLTAALANFCTRKMIPFLMRQVALLLGCYAALLAIGDELYASAL